MMNINETILNDIPQARAQGLITHVMVVTHHVQKHTMELLQGSGRYKALNPTVVGYVQALAGRSLTPGELAAKMGVSKQVCSKSLRELSKQGLVARCDNPLDSRSSVLSLSETGQQLLQDASDAARGIQQQFAQSLGEEQLQSLVSVLEKLCISFDIDLTDDATGSYGVRLTELLPKLNRFLRDSLLVALSEKGFVGIKSSFGQVLGCISREAQRIQYIASVLGISRQAVAVMGGELEQLGYAERVVDPNDKRQIILRLSPQGKQLMTQSVRCVENLQAVIQKNLSTEEFQVLDAGMATLYFQVAHHFDAPGVLREKIRQVADYLLAELGVTGSHALAQHLLTLTRGKQ